MSQVHFVYHDFFTFVRVYNRDIVYVEKPNSYTDNQFHDTWYSDQLESMFIEVLQDKPHNGVLIQGTSPESSVYKIEFLQHVVELAKAKADKYSYGRIALKIEELVDQYTNLRENLCSLGVPA